MPVIGLTGSFGSGKSTVAGMFAERGAVVIDADEITHRLQQPGTPVFDKIVRLLGREVVQPDGELDRKAIAKRVFSDPSLREKINDIVHPRVREEEMRALEENRSAPLVVLNVPLLLENKMDSLVDHVVVVVIEEPQRMERLLKRSGISKEEVVSRLATQIPQSEKVRRAHHVIDNSGSLEFTRRQVDHLIEQISPELLREACKQDRAVKDQKGGAV
ncbi:MAG: dephospho-CoA kinase [bacterium]